MHPTVRRIRWTLATFAFALGIQCLGALPDFIFADATMGKRFLSERDEFALRLSAFDRAARLKTDRQVLLDEFLADNFSYMILQKTAPSPEIVDGLRNEITRFR